MGDVMRYNERRSPFQILRSENSDTNKDTGKVFE
jgi:hypothetical protein